MTDTRQKSLLFVSAIDTPFVRDDLDFLRRHFEVRENIGHGFGAAVKVLWRTLSTDCLFCWFASMYAFAGVAVARHLGVRSVVIVVGVDAA
jgi:glycosyltransferase involved in cell wall biosynthesis